MTSESVVGEASAATKASRALWAKRLNGLLFFVLCGLLLTVSWLAMQAAGRTVLKVPIFFDTLEEAVASIIGLGFLAFFMTLMTRHVLLLVFSVLDQVDRAFRDRREERNKSKPKFQPLITILAPAFNEGLVIQASITSLLTIDYPNYEVFIIDDGSTDDTLVKARALEGTYGNARIEILWKPNGGKSSALNFGLARAAGDFFVCMDSDSALSPDSLKAMIGYFEDPSVAAVAGSVEVTNLSTIWCKMQYLEYIKGLNLVRRAQGFVKGVSIVPGPIGMFRKSAVMGVGGYAHDTFAEDCDLTLALLMDGWKVCFEPRAIARTEAPEDLIPLIKQRYRWTRGILQAMRKHRSALFGGKGSFTSVVMLWYMVFEALIWPIMTGVTVFALLATGVGTAIRPAAVYFFIMLIALDTVTSLYCLAIDDKSVLYALLVPFERLVFTIVLDVCRILTSVEELLGIRMSWGKLDRKGRV